MLTSGSIQMGGKTMDAFCWSKGMDFELCLSQNGKVVSAYKYDGDNEFVFINATAKDAAGIIRKAIGKKVAAKNMTTAPFELGIMDEATFTLRGGMYCKISKYKKEMVGLYIMGGSDPEQPDYLGMDLVYRSERNLIPQMKYVKLTKVGRTFDTATGRNVINTKSLEEIALYKDVTWLKTKKYYIVNDEATAERIFRFLENYDGPIAYDTETTGLKINCFSKYGSQYKKSLEEYNRKIYEEYRESVESGVMTEEELEAKYIKSDTLTGIIFCWKPDESYYFPCGNRMFYNLYENKQKPETQEAIRTIRQRNKLDDPQCEQEMSQALAGMADDEIPSDVILMLRVKDILQNKHIVAHNGTFEWKVGNLYDIITQIKDDTMILHQITYKFMDTSRNSGEPSNLKYLTNKEFGVDQLDLADFFDGYSEAGAEVKGTKKKKKKSFTVDFSYMDYNGSRAYAPADGDFTLQLFYKYKKALLENFKEIEYIYNVEVLTSCAIAYMEFYGHRIDETKINGAKEETIRKCNELEAKVRELGGVKPEDDFNIGSPAQVADLFFNKMGIPFKGDKPSVSKKELKRFKGLKDENGNPKYPIIDFYSDWKKQNTLITKFFDNLPNFMYPGGYIFSSFRQIETGTGRMSCSKPNCQQYPKVVTAMVIPRDDCVMFDADYSQIEYRVLTAMAKEQSLMEMFKDPDTDYHTLMASRMYGVDYALVTPQMRSDAKSFNFGIPYGMGFGSLAILLRGANTPEFREEAMEKYEMYFKDQPHVRQFFNDVKEGATINKYTRTYFNRRRYYSFTDKDGNYSNAHKARALRQAGNACIQGSAADIFKIAMARVYSYIRRNKLFGKFFITNMIHDEGLYEVNVKLLNPKVIFKDIVKCMSYHIDGFPPLFVGGGFGTCWKNAKGGQAEIHPTLGNQISASVEGQSVFTDTPKTAEEVVAEFDELNFNFRRDKVATYLCDEKNFGKALHPVIGSLLNSFFGDGVPEDEENRTMKVMENFIEKYNLPISASVYENIGTETGVEEEEDSEYEDEDEEEINEDSEGEIGYSEFSLIDESDQAYGVDLVDLISLFGYMVSSNLGVCGIDARHMKYSDIEKMSEYLEKYHVEEGDYDENCLEVVLLKNNNILNRTGYYVRGIEGSKIATLVKSHNTANDRVPVGTIEERCAG